MITHSQVTRIIAALLVTMAVSGCASVQSAYDSTVDTVSGWFKSDPNKK